MMADEPDSDALELIPDKGETPVWPNLPDVPIEERRRAWCLATSLETLPQSGKLNEIAKNAVAAAGIFEDYIVEGRRTPKLTAVKE